MPEKKVSEIFEGPNSSLKKAFDSTVDFDLPEVPDTVKKGNPRVHDFSSSTCVGCEG